VPSPRLVTAVDELGPTPHAGLAYRHQAAGWNPLSGAGARIQGGRWNPPNSFATIYLAVQRETAIAEFNRMAARSGRRPEDFTPRRLYQFELRLRGMVDLRPAPARKAVDLGDAEILGDDASACQAVGEAAESLGREGIIAPSATGLGIVLAVFFDRLASDSTIAVRGYETWSAPPAG
jgi:RES domain-containing protein